MAVKFRARRAFGYNGEQRLNGEVFDRAYLINDEKLLSERFAYVALVEESELKTLSDKCDICGKIFINQSYYDAHLPVLHQNNHIFVETPVTKLEDEYPGGMVIDGKTGRIKGA